MLAGVITGAGQQREHGMGPGAMPIRKSGINPRTFGTFLVPKKRVGKHPNDQSPAYRQDNSRRPAAPNQGVLGTRYRSDMACRFMALSIGKYSRTESFSRPSREVRACFLTISTL